MADRVVRVVLEAELAKFEQNMRRAEHATEAVADAGDRLERTHAAMTELGRAGVVMGAAVAAGVGVAVAKFADFDQAMSNVAATGQDARDNIDALREAAMDAGAKTVFSAKESANAIEEMAKAGVDAKDILGGGLSGALDLAAAGGLGVADAAGIAATALKTFKLEGSDMSHVADLLAAGAGKAMGDVSDLSMALRQGGQAAALTGLSIEETTASLAAFASQGLLGSDAGTSLKTMLLSLNPTTDKAAQLMEELNLSAFDQQGHFIGVAEYAGKLKTALGSMSEAQQTATLKTIFGTDAYRAAAVMLDEGEQGMRKWIAAVDDSGYASDVAAERLDNLKGDWEQLMGAMDSAFIAMGAGADGPLRDLVKGLTGMVDGFNELPEPMKQGALMVGVVTAGIGLLGGGLLLAIPKIAAFKLALAALGVTGASVHTGLGRFASFLGSKWAIALVAATALMATYNRMVEEGIPTQDEIANKMATTTDAAERLSAAVGKNPIFPQIDENTRNLLTDLPSLLDQAAEAQDNWFIGLMKSSTASDNAFEALDRYGDALASLAVKDMPAAQAGFADLVESYGLTDKQAKVLLDRMPALKDAFISLATEQGIAADSSDFLSLALGRLPSASGASADGAKSAADAYMEEADAADNLTAGLSKLIDTINEANGVGQDAVTANARYQEALAGLTDQVEKNGTSLDQATEAGSANAASLADVAAAAQTAAKAQFEQDKTTMTAEESTQKYVETLKAQRQAFIDSAVKAGYNREEVEKLADQVFQLPSKKEIDVLADTTRAQWTLTDYMNRFGRMRGVIEYRAQLPDLNGSASGSGRPGLADGGIFHGKVKAFANSGFEPGIYPYTPGGIHKFAEEYDEVYISGDPKRKARSEQVWLRAGREFGFSQPSVNVAAPSLEGMQIRGTLDLGNGLTGFVQGIVQERGDRLSADLRSRRRSDA